VPLPPHAVDDLRRTALKSADGTQSADWRLIGGRTTLPQRPGPLLRLPPKPCNNMCGPLALANGDGHDVGVGGVDAPRDDADVVVEGNRLQRRRRAAADWKTWWPTPDEAAHGCGERVPTRAASSRSLMAAVDDDPPSIDIVIDRPRDSDAIDDRPEVVVIWTRAVERAKVNTKKHVFIGHFGDSVTCTVWRLYRSWIISVLLSTPCCKVVRSFFVKLTRRKP
jgi:hypothetical protein